MSEQAIDETGPAVHQPGWRELWQKEDWWAVWIGLGFVLLAYALFVSGSSLAWIGTSEFAAAQTYGGWAGPETSIAGTSDQAVQAYTLIKVVGRDVWIGIWAFVLSIVSVTLWEPGQIWWRFPKFVVGFLLASLLITYAVHAYSFSDYNKVAKPGLVGPLVALRTWAFTFSFLSIGLTTRVREFAAAGGRPFWAFTAGAVVNIFLGYFLSVHVFGDHWTALGH